MFISNYEQDQLWKPPQGLDGVGDVGGFKSGYIEYGDDVLYWQEASKEGSIVAGREAELTPLSLFKDAETDAGLIVEADSISALARLGFNGVGDVGGFRSGYCAYGDNGREMQGVPIADSISGFSEDESIADLVIW